MSEIPGYMDMSEADLRAEIAAQCRSAAPGVPEILVCRAQEQAVRLRSALLLLVGRTDTPTELVRLVVMGVERDMEMWDSMLLMPTEGNA